MRVYDHYEISPCQRLDDAGLPDPNGFLTVACEPDEADVWTLDGHLDGEGVQTIGEFLSREEAEEVYARITGQPFTGADHAAPRLRAMHAGPDLLAALEVLLAGISDLASDHAICDEILHSSYGRAAQVAVQKARAA